MAEPTLKHIAIIMDGNGRWAQARGLPRVAGHVAGANAVREVVRAAVEMGIPFLTLYAFSQENWKRPPGEVSVLMDLLDHFLKKEVSEMAKEGVSLRTIGRVEALPGPTLAKLQEAVERTRGGKKLVLTIALNYGARQEILDAAAKLLQEAKKDPAWLNGSRPLTEELFAGLLYTRGLPDPDLLIRTSGEMRISNFLLWQISYAEIYITPKFWPDFTREDLLEAVNEYRKRERRFGGVLT